jgi:ABC-2 type transport system permease protein
MLEHSADFSDVTLSSVQMNGQDLTLLSEDPISKVYFYKLTKTMQPGDTALLNIQVDMHYKGFLNDGLGRLIVYNGTFFDLGIFPSFGYSGDRVVSDNERKKYGLPTASYSAPPQNDHHGLSTLLFNDDADLVTFEATISTSADQIAVAPGYLEKEWEENGRKYYYYKMDTQMDLFANFSSARYSMLRDVWTGNAGNSVSIEIFHHPTHTYNLGLLFQKLQGVSISANANTGVSPLCHFCTIVPEHCSLFRKRRVGCRF